VDYLTPMRLANDALNRVEQRVGHVHLWSTPVHVTIEPTNLCNSRCLMCLPYRRDSSLPHPTEGYLSWDTLERLRPVLRRSRQVLFGGFGEPLLHPEYARMAAWLRQRVPYVYMFTNGTLLTPDLAAELVAAGIDMVSFSVGGASEAVQRRVRGVGLEPVVEGVAALQRARESAGSTVPRMRFNVVAMNSVLPELRGIVDLAKSHGVERIDMPQLWVESPGLVAESPFMSAEADTLLATARAYAVDQGIDLQVYDYPPAPAGCTGPWRSLTLSFDGVVYSCQFERYKMGALKDDQVLRIWRSRAFSELRRRTARTPEVVCPGCPNVEGTAECYTNPVVHGRHLAPEWTPTGPSRVESARVCDTVGRSSPPADGAQALHQS
jgi:radical SAM protein with 4Fe4S-binding SPASM domain